MRTSPMGVALGEQQNQWLSIAVTDRVQLGGQASFGPPDTAGNNPFLRKLAAVRCALRWVGPVAP